MGDRHPGGDQHAFQRCRAFITVSGRPPRGCQVGLNAIDRTARVRNSAHARLRSVRASSGEDKLGTVVPLSDASRRPRHFPAVTALIIVINVVVFMAELMRGDAFVLKWSVVPADIVAGHHWITILTAMFLHGSWSHIIRQHGVLVGFRPGNRRRHESAALLCVLSLSAGWWPCWRRL